MRQHVLDANALFRYLTRGDGAQTVAGVFKQALATDTPVMMSVVNWGEVYYTLVKRIGLSKTENVLVEVLEKTPLSLIRVDRDEAVKAARLKAQYSLHYADAFAAALAGGQHVLVTSDVAHFVRLPKIRLLKLPHAGAN
jgi:predicted nucleic acid-binding protein